MKHLLIAAATMTMLMAGSPAFAGPAAEAEDGVAVYPPGSVCHFVTHRMVTSNGRIVLERQQVCN
jgi:hypothetical protein